MLGIPTGAESQDPGPGATGEPRVSDEPVRILDLGGTPKDEWQPPIGALGGPPAHELYHDLVVHAGLRLLRDAEGRPWIEIQDGERRRSFLVPSHEMRAALDRFRMRRNLRPVPEPDIQEFARVIEARAMDPDVALPEPDSFGSATDGAAEEGPMEAPTVSSPMETPEPSAVERLDQLMREVDEIQGRATAPSEPDPADPRWNVYVHPVPLHSRLPHQWQASVSGGRRGDSPADSGLSRYLRALRDLVQDGAWIGSLHDIGRRTGDDVEEVFAALLKFHTDLVAQGLVVAPVELENGWQWVVVDRARVRSGEEPPVRVP